ncbi:MAG TPA: hypothetical protein DCX80_02960 [Chloroflexi bacterium]|nr:hypothetical protein [Chloroflexota bacterium]
MRQRHLRALADLIPLEVGQDGQHLENHPARCGGGVDLLGHAHQVGPLGVQPLGDFQHVAGAARQSADAVRHQRHALGGGLQRRVQALAPVHAGPADPGILEHGHQLGVVEAAPGFDLGPLRRALTRSGFDTEISSNIHTAVWNKLVANIAINALTAITGVRNGDLLDDPDLQPIIARLVAETVAVMQAAGVPAGMDDPLGYARKVMRDTSVASSSMLQDIRYGRQTEVDAINGAVARLGAELGVPTPVNRLLTTLVHNRERGVRREGPALKLGGASDDE